MDLFQKQKDILANMISSWGESDDPQQRVQAQTMDGFYDCMVEAEEFKD